MDKANRGKSNSASNTRDPSKPSSAKLSWKERLNASLIALLCVLVGVWLKFYPQESFSREHTTHRSGEWVETHKYDRPGSLVEALVVVAVGLGFALFALNGRRLQKIMLPSGSGADFGNENDAQVKDAAEQLKELETKSPKKDASGNEGRQSSTAPSQKFDPDNVPETTQIEMADGIYYVYRIADVPTVVMSAALNRAISSEPAPTSMSQFQFAIRKSGRGNHSWLVSFQGLQRIWVSFGGQGKSEPTTSWVDEAFPTPAALRE